MKTKKIFIILGLLLIPFGYLAQEIKIPILLANSEDFYTKIKIFTSVLETIQRAYIEEKTTDDLLEDALKGVISNLDPHTVYLPANDFRNWNQNFEGYTGIGISFEIINDRITIMSVLRSSPAEEHDIQPGDKILKIDGEYVVGIAKEKALAKLNGAAGLPVNLTISSSRWEKSRDFNLIRERIILESIPNAMMIKPQIGYIKIDRFTSTTSRELEKSLYQLEKKGMSYLILDLRGNSGGYLNSAVEVTDKFIPGGNLIVSTKGRLSSSFQEFYSTSEKTHALYPLIILIDHGSASASEIVAGAIQDLDRGLIVGKTSFGKGLVQSQYRFHDGSALLITTARYYTPSGRPIQRQFYDKSKDEYYREAYDDSLMKSDNFPQPKSEFTTLLGRKVYAEGGITPDIWVENEANILSEPVRRLFYSEKRPFHVYIEDFLKKYPQIKLKDEDSFIDDFTISEHIFRDFTKFVSYYEPDIAIDKLKNDINKKNITFLLKREMAYMIWGKNAQFRVNLLRDHQLNEAIKYLPEAYDLLSMANHLN